MRSLHIGGALLCAAALLLEVSLPQDAVAAPSQPDFNAIAARAFAKGKLPGMAVAIVRNGAIVFEAGYGRADIAKKVAVTPATPFAVGSISKQFTAVCVLMLAARGKLSLDDPISKYVPSLPNASAITLRQALWQVSGLHNYPDTNEHNWPLKGSIEPSTILAILATDKSDFPPGTQWAYSNTNYAVLARVVELASGMPYGRFVEANVFKPLGMSQSGYGFAAQSSLPVATAYTGSPTFSTYPVTLSLDLYYGAGGIVSSAHDMGLWLDGLLSKRVLDSASTSLLLTAGHLSNGDAVNYAMGFVPTTVNGHREAWHNGFAPNAGGYCYDAVFPDDGIGIVVLTNADEGAGRGVPEALTRELFEAMIPAVAQTPEDPAITSLAQRYWSQMAAGKVDVTTLSPGFGAAFTPDFQAKLAASIAALGSPSWSYLGRYPDAKQTTRYEYRLQFPAGPRTFELWINAAGKIAGSYLTM